MNKLEKRIVPLVPSSELYYERGGQAFDVGEIDQATHCFDRGASLCETEEEWAYGMCQVALLEQYAGRFEASMAIFENVLKVQASTYPEMLYFQANNYAYLERYNHALSLANYYLACHPDGEYAQEAREFVETIQAEGLVFPR